MNNNLKLNPISYRKLKNGSWILLASKDEPIVVDKETKDILLNKTLDPTLYEDGFTQILREGGFIESTSEKNTELCKESSTKVWLFLRIMILSIGLTSLISVLISIFIFRVPIGDSLLPKDIPIGKSLLFALVFSLATTTIHELMHITFGESWHKTHKFNIFATRSVATVSLSHIWTWSLLGRIAAVCAGMAIDLFFLTILTYAQVWINSWMLIVACSLLWLRILWQLRLHKRSDGQLLISICLDDPFLNSELKTHSNLLNRMTIIKLFGYFFSLILISIWLIPFILRIFQLINRV